ncbi:MAG: hypothetical protein P1U74_02045 [Legionellaceae bacterium]|nr:hypothetical protein [Legionellaceae bacterium]
MTVSQRTSENNINLTIKEYLKNSLFVTLCFFSIINSSDAAPIELIKSSIKFIKENITIDLALSGGYSQLQDADNNTGQNGLIRLGIGSSWNFNEKLQFGSELGFQTGTQMLLTDESTAILGPGILPVTLHVAPPVDLLLTMKVVAYGPVFIQAKGGYAHQSLSVNGADVTTSHIWIPEAQLGMGLNISSKSRLSIYYQRFFGKKPILTNLDESTGVSYLNNSPTMQAILLTAEITL